MNNKVYTICLACGTVQVRTDVVTDLSKKAFVILDRKTMCPKCRILTQQIATKNLKQLKNSLANSDNALAKKLVNYIR